MLADPLPTFSLPFQVTELGETFILIYNFKIVIHEL